MAEEEQLFPYMEYFDEDFPFTGRMNPEIDKLSLEWLDPNDIFVTKRHKSVFSTDALQTILEDFNLGRIKSVNIARIMDVDICWNGQHTIAAMMLNGWTKVPCMVYTCEDMTWRLNSQTHMKFSTRQRADIALDLLEELNEEKPLYTFNEIRTKLEQMVQPK
mgnify:FL=1